MLAILPALTALPAGPALLLVALLLSGVLVLNLVCGWLFDHVGAQATYFGCGIGALVLGLATPLVLPKTGREHAI
jgi:hypothetical protein